MGVSMRSFLLALVLIFAGLAQAHAQIPADASEEIIVTGERSGPRVWRISKDGHELVVFGTISPLPKGVKWNSKTVEALIGDADVVTSTRITVNFPGVGPFKLVGLLLEFRKQSKSAEGAKLKDVLDPDLYARFSAARARYGAAPDEWETLRPLVAAGRLREQAYDEINLKTQDLVGDVQKIAKKKKKKWTTTSLTYKGNAKLALREAFAAADQNEIGCLKETLDQLELDLPSLRSRANAWARGDVASLRAMPEPQRRKSCADVLRGSKELSRLLDEANAKWRETVEQSVQKNSSTFLVADIDTLLFGDFLKSYRDKGYKIEEP